MEMELGVGVDIIGSHCHMSTDDFQQNRVFLLLYYQTIQLPLDSDLEQDGLDSCPVDHANHRVHFGTDVLTNILLC